VKLVQLVKMCLNEICNKIWIGKHLSDTFAIQNGLKNKGYVSSSLLESVRLGISK
jgi:hypothetical protein